MKSLVSDTATCLFFFQAEDGIRDADVTGVQTCALPISVTKNASANPLGCAVKKSLDLKSPGMNSYKKTGGSPLLFAFARLPFSFCPLPFSACLSPLCGLPFMVYLRAKKEDFNTASTKNAEDTEKKV